MHTLAARAGIAKADADSDAQKNVRSDGEHRATEWILRYGSYR
jgi:hypothetical protein